MPTPAMPAARIRYRAQLFRRNKRGSAAVEFALVAPLFFALLFATLEFALMFFASQYLETVTQDSARMILTGQAQGAKFDKAQFKESLCNRVVALFDCDNGISIDVQAYSSFAAITPEDLAPPIDRDSKSFIDNMRYVPGGPGEIVMVRVFYQWKLYVIGLGFDISNLAGGKRLLMATAAFRNEPFGVAPASGS
jgi:Flp pilus assembly protein TadG